jgi:hypothetical protein
VTTGPQGRSDGAAVHPHDLAGDPPAALAREEGDDVRDLLDGAEPVER